MWGGEKERERQTERKTETQDTLNRSQNSMHFMHVAEHEKINIH